MKALVPGHTAREEQSWGLTPELDPRPCRNQVLGDPRGHWLPNLGRDPLRGSFSAGSGRAAWVGTESRNTGPLPTPSMDVWGPLLLTAGDGSACVSVFCLLLRLCLPATFSVSVSVHLFPSVPPSLYVSLSLPISVSVSLCLYMSLPLSVL